MFSCSTFSLLQNFELANTTFWAPVPVDAPCPPEENEYTTNYEMETTEEEEMEPFDEVDEVDEEEKAEEEENAEEEEMFFDTEFQSAATASVPQITMVVGLALIMTTLL